MALRSGRNPDDLGFGGKLGTERGKRLINRDGSFTVRRTGLGLRGFFSAYQTLLSTTWPRFLLFMAAGYLAINLVFAALFLACGPNAIGGLSEGQQPSFEQAFFLSVHTISGVGYGHMHPSNRAADIVMTFESFAGLLVYAVGTGLAFARFSRARAVLGFSDNAVVAPYGDGTGLMFRVVNKRRNEILDVGAKVILTTLQERGGEARRNYITLDLERESVELFPMTWTVVHPIVPGSPLYGRSEEDLRTLDAEILVILKGTDEPTAQSVFARTSYRYDDVLWNRRFADIFERDGFGVPQEVDVRRIHEIAGTTG